MERETKPVDGRKANIYIPRWWCGRRKGESTADVAIVRAGGAVGCLDIGGECVCLSSTVPKLVCSRSGTSQHPTGTGTKVQSHQKKNKKKVDDGTRIARVV